MEKIWLKSYPANIPAEIDPDLYQSIVEVFETSCREFRRRPAFYNMGITLTYKQIDRLSRDFAAYLQQVLKLKKGKCIAIMLPNTLQYPVVLFGALRAGLTVVNVNPLYTADELTYQLKTSGAEVIVALTNFAGTVQTALTRDTNIKHVIMTNLGDLFPWAKAWITHIALKYIYKKIPVWNIPNVLYFKQVLKAGAKLNFEKITIANNDIAFLQYTGGTTGISKGAILTHKNMLANLQQIEVWFKGVLIPGREIIITALPLYHIFSLLANCLFFSKIGALNILITNPRDISNMIEEMSKFRFTAITGVNTLFNALLKEPHFAKLDFSHLRFVFGGGMAVQKAIAEKWRKVTGVPLLEGYGLTETSPVVTVNPSTVTEYNGSIGLPIPSTDVVILDENGNPLPIGTPGELAVKGPQVMQGYWNSPEETAKVFTKDGWLLTGDIAAMDENGFLRILERKKDMVLVSGFNVYPNEIENVLMRMPGVRECAIVGVPDEYSGEVVKAFIVADDASLTSEAVVKYCREHLTAYKVPKQIEFRKELPKTNVGKILKRALRD